MLTQTRQGRVTQAGRRAGRVVVKKQMQARGPAKSKLVAKKVAKKSASKSVRKAAVPGIPTNIVLDMALVEKVKAKFGVRTMREAVHAALEAAVKPYDYTELLAAYGSGGIEEGYDPKALYGLRQPTA